MRAAVGRVAVDRFNKLGFNLNLLIGVFDWASTPAHTTCLSLRPRHFVFDGDVIVEGCIDDMVLDNLNRRVLI